MNVKWKYIREGARLNIYGSDGVRDISEVKQLIQEGKIPKEIRTIFYQKSRFSSVGMLFRGRYLDNLLKTGSSADSTDPRKPSFRSILKQINETNTRQTTYAGLLIFATNAKRFLFFLPKGQAAGLYGLVGDNPKEGETATETICRVTQEDCEFEVTPNCLVNLLPIELDGTTYNTYLVLSNHEFKPRLSDRYIETTWRSYDAMEELSLHPHIVQLFEQDTKLQRLIAPIEINFEELIEEILHSDADIDSTQ